jgi:hypothetical protein
MSPPSHNNNNKDSEFERLAVVEVEFKYIKEDVKEIKDKLNSIDNQLKEFNSINVFEAIRHNYKVILFLIALWKGIDFSGAEIVEIINHKNQTTVQQQPNNNNNNNNNEN